MSLIYSEAPVSEKLSMFLTKQEKVDELLLRYQRYGTLVIAVDHDNTIFDYSNRGVDFSPLHQLLKRAKSVGCKIVIYTARHKSEFYLITEFCNDIGLEYDAINEDVIKLKMPTSGKIMYNIFLDDKAGLRETFEVLQATIETIEKQQKSKIKEDMSELNMLLVKEMAQRNTQDYNIMKFLEEMAEINEVTIKFLTKKAEFAPPPAKFHEELAHLELRLAVMKELFGVKETNEQLALKQGQIANRMANNKKNDL